MHTLWDLNSRPAAHTLNVWVNTIILDTSFDTPLEQLIISNETPNSLIITPFLFPPKNSLANFTFFTCIISSKTQWKRGWTLLRPRTSQNEWKSWKIFLKCDRHWKKKFKSPWKCFHIENENNPFSSEWKLSVKWEIYEKLKHNKKIRLYFTSLIYLKSFSNTTIVQSGAEI